MWLLIIFFLKTTACFKYFLRYKINQPMSHLLTLQYVNKVRNYNRTLIIEQSINLACQLFFFFWKLMTQSGGQAERIRTQKASFTGSTQGGTWPLCRGIQMSLVADRLKIVFSCCWTTIGKITLVLKNAVLYARNNMLFVYTKRCLL